jgi:glycosyltransferase involved in cell wall biosynthesis
VRAQTYDPYRGGPTVRLPRIGDEPVDGPVTVHAHVDRYPPFVNAGAEWMLHGMLRHLVRAGHEVHVTTSVHEPADVDGVKVWPAVHARSIAAQADVIVGHLLWTREAVTVAHETARPLLYLVHNDFQVAYWRLDPGAVSALVLNSQWIADAHRAQFPLWDVPEVIVRPPCAVADYAVQRDPTADWITLVNPNPEKGADLFFALAERMPDRRFVTVGGAYGHQRRAPKHLANVLQLPPTPRIAEDVYRHTRVLLVPSKYESWGRVAVEAMCSGIPVIAHPTPGLRESLGDAGLFADRDRPDEWVDLLTALDDPAVYRARSATAVERALLLSTVTERDLAEWERLVRRAAAAARATA